MKFNLMTLIRENNLKAVLYEQGQDEFWSIVLEHYNNGNFKIWKKLAILSLRENAGWSMEMIGLVFGHSRGHISRILSELKKELRSIFEDSPQWIHVKSYAEEA